uniref:Uncharacterized protein n=1 Tax=Moniliophthora roreri TaxID=221103 RepID=A0A0W0FP52_MONRR
MFNGNRDFAIHGGVFSNVGTQHNGNYNITNNASGGSFHVSPNYGVTNVNNGVTPTTVIMNNLDIKPTSSQAAPNAQACAVPSVGGGGGAHVGNWNVTNNSTGGTTHIAPNYGTSTVNNGTPQGNTNSDGQDQSCRVS